MLKPPRQPYGFRNLLAYKKAEELQMECSRLASLFPHSKTLLALADQMNRSARSTKQNIVEGWKRNSTQEYYDFLGFSIGSNTELEEDCNDIWKGIYPELMGLKGLMGEKGALSAPSTHSTHFVPFDIEKIPFYPLDRNLPPIVQLKLRAKESNYLLSQLQKSLENKMNQEKTLSSGDTARRCLQAQNQNQKLGDDFLEQYGFEKLENGQVVEKNKTNGDK
ncbi:MAG: four helix bundle protein [Parcubacteria group bacterium]